MKDRKEFLELWLAETESTKLWFSALTALKNRSLKDTLIACADDLKGLPNAIAAEYPQT